ncbi:MAG: protease HtpX [Bdellovibrionaceae bacterium]|nr:protease HtpX [Bdellovibrio sp.]
MSFFKRIGYFIITNILVVLTISLILGILGAFFGVNLGGAGYGGLFILCLIWGFAGAFISLQLSRWMAKRMYGVQVISPQTMNQTERNLLMTVHSLARKAGLERMPEVGIYESPETNAFATGPSKKRSLVAVSSGLLHTMSETELEGVLAHEITHITNGDMVTLTLIQGVVNSFAMFLAHIITSLVMNAFRRNDNDRPGFGDFMLRQMIYSFVSIAFTLLGSIVVCYFSRKREFRADAGGARISSTERMAGALLKLQTIHQLGPAQVKDDTQTDANRFDAFKISGNKKSFSGLFATHPPLEERLAALKNKTYAAV